MSAKKEDFMELSKRTLLSDNEFRQKVAARAYEIYLDRGGQHGRDLDDWLEAESDVLAEAAQQKKISPERIRPSGAKSAETPQRVRQPIPETQRPVGTSN
jgi:hypothetical protein